MTVTPKNYLIAPPANPFPTMTSHLSHPKYRPDIDGLRAIAVLPVVAFHAFPSWVPGGFIGVDIFFVISGYLISTIIFENLLNSTFSFTEFYARRVSRIFPTLILVMTTSAIIGWLVMLPDEFIQLSKHIAGGAGFISNYLLWTEAGYFDGSGDTKPLLHLWSLGIEEQFYIVWPALLWLAWKIRANLLITTISLTVISFAANIHKISIDPVATFYLPQTRFWELLCGSLLAWITLNKKSNVNTCFKSNSGFPISKITDFSHKHIATFALPSVFGALLLLSGFLTIHDGPKFPGVWALFPVLGTVLMIAAGPSAWLNKNLLSQGALVWVGRISFPLYLWHWPLLSIVRTIEGETPAWQIRVAAIMLSVILAWLTYRLVEIPIRHSRNTFSKIFALVAALAILGLAAFGAYKIKLSPHTGVDILALNRQIGQTLPVADAAQNNRCRTMFPERSKMVSKERDDNFCHLEKEGLPNVILIGDSVNHSLFPGLSGMNDSNILVLSASAAAPMYDTRTTNWNDVIRKNNFQLTNQALDYASNADNIEVVVLSFLNGPAITNPSIGFNITDINDIEEKDARKIFTRALTTTLKKLTNRNKSVIFVLPNPILTFDIKSCLKEERPFRLTKKPGKVCADSYTSYMKHGGAEYRNWVATVLEKFPQVEVFDLAKEVCDSELCWGMRDGKIIYRDTAHLSIDGSRIAAAPLAQMIRRRLEKP